MSRKCRSFHSSSKMATRYFHKLLSLFHRQPDAREDTRYLKIVNGVFGDWTTSAVEDIPPPYADSPGSEAQSRDEESFPPPPFEAPCLRICPHETLSFEGFQQVGNSFAIDGTDDCINALMTSCHEHRGHLDPATGKTKTVCVSSPGSLTGSGTYALENWNHTLGVVLCFDWNLGLLDGARVQIESADEVKHFFGAEAIPLCPHKRMSDSDVIDAIFGLVKRRSSRDVIADCERCATEIKVTLTTEGEDEVCHVTTKRHLGSVEQPDDPDWLAQRSA